MYGNTLADVTPPATPNLDKEASCRDESSIIGQFVEWLLEQSDGERLVFDIKLPDVLYGYFDIDAAACERERRELLAFCRAGNALRDARKELGIEPAD